MSSVECLKCGFKDHIDNPIFCQECGANLINYCNNDMCNFNNGESTPLPFNAKFCPECGGESTFKSLGYFDKKS